jgi:hypothetical protein
MLNPLFADLVIPYQQKSRRQPVPPTFMLKILNLAIQKYLRHPAHHQHTSSPYRTALHADEVR